MATATDLDTIEAAIRIAIETMTPRWQRAGAVGWKFYRKARTVSISARWFRLEWDPRGHRPEGFMGPNMVETDVGLAIVTDYGGVPADEMRKMAEDDHFQLRDVLNRLKNSVPGLWWVESEGFDGEADVDVDQAQGTHGFLVRYMKARA
jgi:hypothetical protein